MWQVRELQMLASYSLNLKDVYFHKLIIGWILNTTPTTIAVMLPEWINVAWLKLSSAGVTAPDTGGVCLCRLVTVTLLPVCLCLRLPEGGWLTVWSGAPGLSWSPFLHHIHTNTSTFTPLTSLTHTPYWTVYCSVSHVNYDEVLVFILHSASFVVFFFFVFFFCHGLEPVNDTGKKWMRNFFSIWVCTICM